MGGVGLCDAQRQTNKALIMLEDLPSHTEESDICECCILTTIYQMMEDRGYRSREPAATPMPDAISRGIVFTSDGVHETTDMPHSLYGLNQKQTAVVLLIKETVSIRIAREIDAYKADHEFDHLIVVIASSSAKSTPQVNAAFRRDGIELFPGAELRTNRHRNSMVPEMKVLSPAEAKNIPHNQRAAIKSSDTQCRYLHPPIGTLIKIIVNNGQTQPKLRYREVVLN